MQPVSIPNLLHASLVKDNTTEFCQMVIHYSSQLEINPNWLMQVMYKETGGRFSPSIVNESGTNAVGLIQFMPLTALKLGTTIEELKKMDNVDQLYYVYKYLLPFKGKMKDFGDVYLAIFFPRAIGKPDDFRLPKYVTRQNKGLDINKDGFISKGEIIKWASAGLTNV